MPVQEQEFIPTRTSLLGRLKDWDDQESWKDFFETYWKLLYSVARRAGLSEPEAQDIVQETILAVAKQMPNFHYDPSLGSFKGWLLLVTRRRIIDFLRKRGRDQQRQHAPADHGTAATGTGFIERIPDPAGDQIDRLYHEEWEQHIFQSALERVRRDVDYEQYQMFDCYAVKGWPVAEVAKNLSTTVAAVYTAKYRVAKLIKEEVERLEQKMI